MLSHDLRHRLVEQRLYGRPLYRLAIESGLSPSTLSAMLHQARAVRPGDPRIIALGRLVGLRPEECFEQEEAVTR